MQSQWVFQIFNNLKVHPSRFQFILQHQIEKSRAQTTLLAGYKIIMQYQNKFVCGTEKLEIHTHMLHFLVVFECKKPTFGALCLFTHFL